MNKEIKCFCTKCNKIVTLTNTSAISDGDFLKVTGFCPKHDIELKISGHKDLFKNCSFKSIEEKIWNEELNK